MSDLTVLVSPTSVYPNQSHSLTSFRFKARTSPHDSHSRKPVMVVLESVDESDEPPPSPVHVRSLNTSEFLSPPEHTFRAPSAQSPSDSTNLPPPRTFHDMGIFTHVPPRRSFFSSSFSVKTGVQNRSAELRKPPPLLFRPTAFWKKTRRSGVTAAAYSPSSFVVRRSTFIAAGLSQDRPGFDSSALAVESRVRVLVLGPDHGI
ncbi:hypothetical protein EDC04DRAFT_666124 [Pisolithus marmoratus]|nr:hypothetical protein EDC04DRAFT_666124 [Pisolithus marmoratus]